MRLIDADKLEKEWTIASPEPYNTDATEVLDSIRGAPTVDAVVVTRCKNCVHFNNYGKTSLLVDGKNIKAGWCHRRARYDEEYRMPHDGFCSYGERKDGGDAT